MYKTFRLCSMLALFLIAVKKKKKSKNDKHEKGTYCMEWVPLVDRNLEVSLELIKSCNLAGGKGKDMTIQ